jgi:VanZ family protein
VLKKYSWFLLAIAYTIFVFVISLIKINKPVEVKISHFDKLVHVGIYFVFTIVWFMAIVKNDIKRFFFKAIVKASILAFVTGVLIELLQDLNPNARSGDVKDVIANSIGILFAVLFVSQIKKYHTLNSTK